MGLQEVPFQNNGTSWIIEYGNVCTDRRLIFNCVDPIYIYQCPRSCRIYLYNLVLDHTLKIPSKDFLMYGLT
jgi:hypothetical protein